MFQYFSQKKQTIEIRGNSVSWKAKSNESRILIDWREDF